MKIELNENEMLILDSVIKRKIETYDDIIKQDEKNICKTIRKDRETLINFLNKLWGKERR